MISFTSPLLSKLYYSTLYITVSFCYWEFLLIVQFMTCIDSCLSDFISLILPCVMAHVLLLFWEYIYLFSLFCPSYLAKRMSSGSFLCRLRSIAAHRDHFVRHLSVCPSGSHTFLVVTHSYVSQAEHAFLGMLPLCFHCPCHFQIVICRFLGGNFICKFWIFDAGYIFSSIVVSLSHLEVKKMTKEMLQKIVSQICLQKVVLPITFDSMML